jgi:hypothetical protein
MFDPSTNPAQSIPPSSESWLRREAIYQRFERAWQDHGAPILAEFLPPPGAADRREVLEELVQIDLEYRWARRQPHKLESFIALFP